MAFCKNCGAQMNDDERFCPVCGQDSAAGNAAPAKAQSGGNIIQNLLAQLKTFISKNIFKGGAIAAKSKTFEWAIIAGTFMIIFALGAMVTVAEYIPARLALNAAGEMTASDIRALIDRYLDISYGAVFGLSLVAALGCFGFVFGGAFLHVNVINKSKAHIFSVLNMVAYSFIPVTAALLLNMLFGLVWLPIALAVDLVAIFMQVSILSEGVKELNGGVEPNPFLKIAVWGAVTICICILLALIYLVGGPAYGGEGFYFI